MEDASFKVFENPKEERIVGGRKIESYSKMVTSSPKAYPDSKEELAQINQSLKAIKKHLGIIESEQNK